MSRKKNFSITLTVTVQTPITFDISAANANTAVGKAIKQLLAEGHPALRSSNGVALPLDESTISVLSIKPVVAP